MGGVFCLKSYEGWCMGHVTDTLVYELMQVPGPYDLWLNVMLFHSSYFSPHNVMLFQPVLSCS
jgi:hypothetical protein